MPKNSSIAEKNDRLPVFPKSDLYIPLWIQCVVVLGALLLGTGGVLALVRPAMLVSPHDGINGAVHVYAAYLTSRNGALAILLLVLVLIRAKRSLSNVMVLIAFIQFFDAVLDTLDGRWMIAPGITIFGITFLIAAKQLAGHPCWNVKAWK